MHGQHLHAGALECTCQRHSILVLLAPAGAHLQGDGDVARATRRHNCLYDGQRQRLVLHERRASPLVADLFGRAAHVDIDDLCAAIDVVERCVGHHLRLGAGNLHRYRPWFPGVVGTTRSFERVPQIAPGSHHFADCVAGTQAFAQLPKRSIGHASHRGNHQGIRQSEVTNVHAELGRGWVKRWCAMTRLSLHSSCPKFQQLKSCGKNYTAQHAAMD